ncbi:MAG: hypothetical protein BVN35_08920 [Proteobacteria bacterium ST_bin11]|jgi:hypothetical protein|nr:MAG: hypothetical protein BVN35_08920 [Proteobacteria bacterium ST_bin11]
MAYTGFFYSIQITILLHRLIAIAGLVEHGLQSASCRIYANTVLKLAQFLNPTNQGICQQTMPQQR